MELIFLLSLIALAPVCIHAKGTSDDECHTGEVPKINRLMENAIRYRYLKSIIES